MRAIALVVDTNFVMANKELLQAIQSKSQEHKIITVVPFALIQELDAMKKPFMDVIDTKQKQVRSAISWVYDQLANLNPLVRAQKLSEVCEKGLRGDDAILDCCIYFKEKESAFTVLLSNDKNLCNKAIIHGIPTVSATRSSTAQTVVDMIVKHANRQPNSNEADDTPMEFTNDVTMHMVIDDDPLKEHEQASNTGNEADMDVSMDEIAATDEKPQTNFPAAPNIEDIPSPSDSSPSARSNPTMGNISGPKHGSSSDLYHTNQQHQEKKDKNEHFLASSKHAHKAPKSTALESHESTIESYQELLDDLCRAIEAKLVEAFPPESLKMIYQRPKNFSELYHVFLNFKLPLFGSTITNRQFTEMKKHENFSEDEPQEFFSVWNAILHAIV